VLEHLMLEAAMLELAAVPEGMLLLGRKTAPERVASFPLGRAAGGVPFPLPSRVDIQLLQPHRLVAIAAGEA
jgi:hypothetical protein